MKVGIPSEVKNNEFRVGITPVGVHELVRRGHEVLVQKGAGLGSSITDEEYVSQGATILDAADDVWGEADMVMKVKEPVAEEYHRLREGLTLFTYLHLAADEPLTKELVATKVTSIAYETVQLPSGLLPLLYPMSEVAGCLAPQVGAHSMMKAQGGRGVLMGGIGGVANSKVVVIGAGVAGQNAANIALGMGADVTLLDTDLDKLRMSFWRYDNRVAQIASSAMSIKEQVLGADLVIGTVLIPGAKAPKLVTDDMVAQMKPGSVLVDVAIDQGGCFENSRPTTHADPTFEVHDSIYYCVANMPGAVPHTSTWALTNATMSYAIKLADQGWKDASRGRPGPGAGPEHPRRPHHLRRRRRGLRHGQHHPRRGPVLTGRPPTPTARPTPVGRAVDAWLTHLDVERGASRQHPVGLPPRPRRGGPPTSPSVGVERPEDVREAHVSEFLARLREGDDDHPPLAATSAARTLVAVRGLHRFLALEGVLDADPARRVSPPAPPSRLPKAIPVEDVERLLEAASVGDTPAALRDRALLEVLYGTGARISEAVGLDVDDVEGEDGVVRLRGKGGKERIVPAGLVRRVRARPRGWSGGGRPSPAGGRARPRSSSTPGAAGCRGRAPGRCCGPAPSGPTCRATCRRTRCATRSRPTCSRAAPTCASCRSCSATPR